MTLLSSHGGAASPARPLLTRRHLNANIAERRARLAELEVEMITACEAAAVGARRPTGVTFDRERWGRRIWHHYLAAAMRSEATFGPPMRRLRQEIGQLERLLTLPIAA